MWWRRHGSARGVVVEFMDRSRGNNGRLFTQTSCGTHTSTAKVTYFSYGGTYRDEHSASFTRAFLLDRWRLIAVVAAAAAQSLHPVALGDRRDDPARGQARHDLLSGAHAID